MTSPTTAPLTAALERIKNLFDHAREAAGSSVWSKGVDLARQDSVSGERQTADEIILRVFVKSSGVGRLVSLFPNDGDWACDCQGKDDPCQHVCAGVIALKRALEQGQELPQSEKGGATLSYECQRMKTGLAFERYAVLADGQRERLAISLTALASGRVAGPPVTPTQDDLAVEMALGHDRYGILPAAIWRKLLPALKPFTSRDATHKLLLDGKPVQVSGETVGLMAVVTDDGPGVKLFSQQDPSIKELFANGVALCGETLRPVALPALDPMQRELLRAPRFYGQRELSDLAGEVLPRLERLIKLEIRTNKLPGMTRAAVAIEIDLTPTFNGQGLPTHLNVKPRLVYMRQMDVIAYIEGGRVVPVTVDGVSPVIPSRDPDAERVARDQLSRDLGWRDGETHKFAGEAAVAMVAKLQTWEGRHPFRMLTGDGFAAFRMRGDLTPEVRFSQDNVAIGFQLAGSTGASAAQTAGVAALTGDRVVRAWRQGAALVPLLGGGFARLPTDWLTRFGPAIEGLLQAKAAAANAAGTDPETTALPRSLMPTAVQLAEAMQLQVTAGMRKVAAALDEVDKIDPKRVTLVCKRLQAQLRDYQKDGVAWLVGLQHLGLGGVLADDMGLGKTVQTLAVLEPRSLVVAPTSVLPNWAKELQRFRPDLRVLIYHGADRELVTQDADVVLTTYALLRRDGSKLQKIKWSTVVLDEAQQIKNPDSQVAQAAYALPAAFRVCLSGTPIENSLDDAWSLFHVACPGLLGDRRSFSERVTRRITAGDDVAAAQLRDKIKPFLLRRLKKQVAVELPARTDMILYAELTQAERDRYESIHAATRADVLAQLRQQAGPGTVLYDLDLDDQSDADRGASGKPVNMIKALEALLRLRQAACHQALLPSVKANAATAPVTTSSKVNLLLSKLTEAASEDHKSLVFSQWTGFLDLMEPALQEAGLSYLRLDGTTKDRGRIVERFQAGEAQVLIMSLKAGGVGLNLTAADHVFIMDPWWNPAAEEQAADRAHRLGQERPVMVYKIVASDTVEERILALQERKKSLAAQIIGGADAASSGQPTGLTRDDLLELLS